MEDDKPPTIQIIHEPFLIRNPWFSIIMVMLFYFLFQLVPQLIYAFFVNTTFIEANPYIARTIDFVSLGLLLLVFIPFLRIPKDNRNYKQYMKDIQLSQNSGKAFLVGLITTLVVFILAYAAVYLSAVLSKLYYVEVKGYFVPESPQVIWNPSYLLDPDAPLNVYYAMTPGIMEELAFRGIILVLLLKKYPWKKAVVIDGILFGLFHLLNLFGPTINYFSGIEGWTIEAYITVIRSVGFQVIYAASLGMVWAFLFVKSKSLLPSIIGHWMIDAFSSLILYPNIGLETFQSSWIYFICITLLGIGILPAILDILIIKGFYKTPPWEDKAEIEVFR